MSCRPTYSGWVPDGLAPALDHALRLYAVHLAWALLTGRATLYHHPLQGRRLLIEYIIRHEQRYANDMRDSRFGPPPGGLIFGHQTYPGADRPRIDLRPPGSPALPGCTLHLAHASASGHDVAG